MADIQSRALRAISAEKLKEVLQSSSYSLDSASKCLALRRTWALVVFYGRTLGMLKGSGRSSIGESSGVRVPSTDLTMNKYLIAAIYKKQK